MQHSAAAAAEESERTFSKLIHSIEKQSGQAKELIRLQEKVAVGQAEKLLEKIQREMAELRKADGALKNLCGTEDHVKFLKVGSNKLRWEEQVGPQHRALSIPHMPCSFLTHQTDH